MPADGAAQRHDPSAGAKAPWEVSCVSCTAPGVHGDTAGTRGAARVPPTASGHRGSISPAPGVPLITCPCGFLLQGQPRMKNLLLAVLLACGECPGATGLCRDLSAQQKRRGSPESVRTVRAFLYILQFTALCSRVVVPEVIAVLRLGDAPIHSYSFERPWSLLSPARLLLARWHCWLRDASAAQRASSAAAGHCGSQTSPREAFGHFSWVTRRREFTPSNSTLPVSVAGARYGNGGGSPLCPGASSSLCPHRAAPGARQRAGAGADDQAGHREKRPLLLQLVRVFLRHRGQRDPGGLHRLVSTWGGVTARHPGPPQKKAPRWQRPVLACSERGFGAVPRPCLAAASSPAAPNHPKRAAGPSLPSPPLPSP